MAEPLSVAASIIAVVGLAYNSCKNVFAAIQDYQDGPEELHHLRSDISALQDLLNSLKQRTTVLQNETISQDEQNFWGSLNPVLKGCQKVCDAFRSKILSFTSNSSPSHLAKRDRIRLMFIKADLKAFSAKIGQYKATISVAVNMATLLTAEQSGESLGRIETAIAAHVNGLTGQIQGIQLALHEVSFSSSTPANEHMRQVLDVLNSQNQMLHECLKFCAPALVTVAKTTGTHVKHARTFDEAKQFIGNIDVQGEGGPAISVEITEARDKAHLFTGNMSAEAARTFWQ